MDIRDYNRRAWNAQVARGNRWTVPVSAAEVERARQGEWQVVLTPTKPVPREWFGELGGARVLGLASAGGQQCPLLAAAGAQVTVYDNSPAQLEQDRQVAAREGLAMEFVEGDMRDLSALADSSFDLIFHPCSNGFVPEVRPVWREAFRVLRPGGVLLAGFSNPVLYLFDEDASQRGELVVRHALPYSDLTQLSEAERAKLIAAEEPLSFGHTLTDQLAGQTDAGFAITGFYEDNWEGEPPDAPLSKYTDCFIATRARKPSSTDV